jgi:REP element-mobilizing transposase RayT
MPAAYQTCRRVRQPEREGVSPSYWRKQLDSRVERVERFARMARQLRVQYPGAIYHLMNRGDRREPIFHDDPDRRCFLETFGRACAKTGWQVHAYCLMPNHFHLVVETPRANLVAGMKWFLGTYTSRFNRRHQLVGHLFSGRYKSLIVEGSGNTYLRAVCSYVHLNPVRARLLSPEAPLQAYVWSSYPEYLKRAVARPAWMRVDRVLGELGIERDDRAGRRRFAEAMEEQRGRDQPGEWRALRRGWFFGTSELKEQLLERMAGGLGAHHGGDERRESEEQQAEQVIQAELGRRRWTEAKLAQRCKTDVAKVQIAARLRGETVMTLDWIAARLQMGCRHTLANCLKQWRFSNSRD